MAKDDLDEQSATELELYVDNDGDLYRRQGEPILRNLANKAAQGKYDHDKAVKLYMYLMDAGAKKYAKEFSSSESDWNAIFSVATRRRVADRFATSFETEYKLGNYDSLLTKVSAKKKAAGGQVSTAKLPRTSPANRNTARNRTGSGSSLYAELKASGAKVDSHESDLYTPDTREARAILARHPLLQKSAKSFHSEGRAWIEVPFAYDPWWEKRNVVRPTVSTTGDGNRAVARGRVAARPKVRKAKRPTCRCRAYPFPHAAGGGRCRG